MFHRIAVINRGEPAVRLIRAVRELDAEYRRFRQRAASMAGISLAEFDALTAVTWSEGDVTPKRVAEATRQLGMYWLVLNEAPPVSLR